MTRRIHIVSLCLLALTASFAAMAENGMNSPYTRFGFGQLATHELGIHKAMGGTGIGMRNYNQIDMLNPASYSTVDTLTFILDMGTTLQNTNFVEGNSRKNAHNATFDYIATQFRLRPGLGMTLAYLPYSNIGYSYTSSETILTTDDGSITSTNTYEGEGGLHQVRGGLGWQPFRWLSLGANANYTYGYLQHSVSNKYSEKTINSRTKIYSADVSAIGFDAGLQLIFGTDAERVVLGATYAPARTLSGQPYAVDYIVSGSVATVADTVHYTPLTLPETMGAGLSWRHGDHLILAADATLTRFGSTTFFDQRGNDRWRYSAGVQYTPTYDRHNLFRCILYRAGAYYTTSYYSVNGHPGPTEFGASLGIGIPIINRWNQRSTVHISGQYVRMQPAVTGMMAENYLRLNLGVSFIENWFTKWRVN